MSADIQHLPIHCFLQDNSDRVVAETKYLSTYQPHCTVIDKVMCSVVNIYHGVLEGLSVIEQKAKLDCL